ncbi:MAG: radical SAM protein [Patescibacteria group bacterium]
MMSHHIIYKDPTKLSLFFTKKCNFDCAYCYLGKKNNQTLSFKKLYEVIDFFLSLPSDQEKEITYMGGEPLVEMDFVKKSALRIRKMTDENEKKLAILHLMTNGYLLSKKEFNALSNIGITFTVSLDGKEETNAAYRKIKSGKFSYKKILKNLSNISLREKGMGNSLVFGPDNVSKLYGNILFISKFGFENIYFLPRLYELWNEKDLKLLKFNFEKIEKYYVSLFKEGDPKKIFTIPYLRKYIDNNNIKTFHCDKLNMDWRGDLFRCWAFLSLKDKIREKYKIDISDFQKSNRKFEEIFFLPAIELFEQLSKQSILESPFCPVDSYSYAILYNKNPKEAVENFININNLYKDFFQNIYQQLRNNFLFKKTYDI